MKIWKNLFGKGDKIDVDEIAVMADTLLGDVVKVNFTTLNSSDRSWNDIEGFRMYYLGGDAYSKGYPTNYVWIMHLGLSIGLIFQVCIGGTGQIWTRRFNRSQDMGWKDVSN